MHHRFDPIGQGARLRRGGCLDGRHMQAPIAELYPIKLISLQAAHKALQPLVEFGGLRRQPLLGCAGRPRSAVTAGTATVGRR
jgi:hypothetical protein